MSMSRALVFCLSAALAGAGWTADIKGFLAARKSAKISAPASLSELGSKIGTQYIEIKGTTKGSMALDGNTKVLIESNGETICVDLPEREPWLNSSNSAARLILKVKRPNEYSGWEAVIVEAIPEEAMAEWEAKNAPKVKPTSTASRQTVGERPGPAPGPSRGPGGRLQSMARSSSDIAASTGTGSRFEGRKTYLQTTLSQWNIVEDPNVPAYADFIMKHTTRITAEEARVAAASIIAFSMANGLDPRFIVALIICESDFDPGCTSYAGAMGLGQIMPFTRDEMKVNSAYDIVSNIYCTVRHFKSFYDRYSSAPADQRLSLAIAAYNAGPGNVKKYGGIPPFPKTVAYIQKMLQWYGKLSGRGEP